MPTNRPPKTSTGSNKLPTKQPTPYISGLNHKQIKRIKIDTGAPFQGPLDFQLKVG